MGENIEFNHAAFRHGIRSVFFIHSIGFIGENMARMTEEEAGILMTDHT